MGSVSPLSPSQKRTISLELQHAENDLKYWEFSVDCHILPDTGRARGNQLYGSIALVVVTHQFWCDGGALRRARRVCRGRSVEGPGGDSSPNIELQEGNLPSPDIRASATQCFTKYSGVLVVILRWCGQNMREGMLVGECIYLFLYEFSAIGFLYDYLNII